MKQILKQGEKSMLAKETVENLKEVISSLKEKKEILKQLQEKFNNENKDLINEMVNLNTEVETQTAIVKYDAIEEFKVNGVKKLVGGIGIRETKVISYNEADALKWAKEKDLFITLDKKAFEKSAESLNLEFVNVNKVIQATIPKEFNF
jgi:hypothetical protein